MWNSLTVLDISLFLLVQDNVQTFLAACVAPVATDLSSMAL